MLLLDGCSQQRHSWSMMSPITHFIPNQCHGVLQEPDIRQRQGILPGQVSSPLHSAHTPFPLTHRSNLKSPVDINMLNWVTHRKHKENTNFSYFLFISLYNSKQQLYQFKRQKVLSLKVVSFSAPSESVSWLN